MTVAEVAEVLRIHAITVYRIIKLGKLKAYRITDGARSSFRVKFYEVEAYRKRFAVK